MYTSEGRPPPAQLLCAAQLLYHRFLHGVLSHIQEVHTYSRQQWRDRETQQRHRGLPAPASHRLEAARPPTNLPPTNLLRGYLGRSAPRPGPAPRPLARSPDQPAGAPPRGRARVSVLF